jgi:hypothetical protein
VWSFTGIYDDSQIVDPNLVGWWKLDGNADDSSGYGNHGVENGSPLYVDAVYDLGIDFDGVNDYINCGNAPRLNVNTNITVACWVKGPLGQSWSPFVSKRGEDSLGWKLRRQGGTNNACFTLRGTSGADDQQGNININDNEWHHVAGTYNGAQRNLYVDGQLDTGGSLAETGAIPATPGDDVVIGAFSRAGQSPPVQTYTDATIDDARIYNRALTQADIAKVIRFNVAWAWKPSPKNGATGVSLEAVLTWNPGDYAPLENGHYVNFGADDPANLVMVSGPQTPNNYTPSALDLDTRYYWAVDEVNAAAPGGVDKGPIWSFTTANNVVVDDMEGYRPRVTDPNIYIYQVWVDGAGDCNLIAGNNTGALVDIATTPVHGGLQAMKFLYDNDGTVTNPCPEGGSITRLTYSKAEALVAQLASGIGSDWTVGGAKALSLWFYGDPSNSVESMWVQLTDGSDNKAKVLYGTYVDEDVKDMNEASWHEWLMDLADFTGVDLTNVKSIAIGIGTEADGGGGAGTLYFDDIRLYAPRCILARRAADFALVDYAPTGNPGGNCVVNNAELQIMVRDWLQYDYNIEPVAPNPAGLMAWYEFENDANDSSDNGNDGIGYGGPTYATGYIDQAISLDRTDDYVNCGNKPSVNITGAVSISAWINIAAGALDQKIAGNQDNVAGGYKMGVYTDNKIEFEIRNSANSGTLNRSVAGGTVLTPGVWYHVVGMYSQAGGFIRTYVDGNLDRELLTTSVLAGSAGPLVLGREPFSAGSFFGGMLDDVRAYNYALSRGEILSLAGKSTVYVPVTSPANISDLEPVLEKKVNFKDYSLLANKWLEEELFP